MWDTDIVNELSSSHFGIICLTPENTEAPWILFEAGALAKSIDRARVCTLLFNLERSEVKGPLTMFQSTKFEIEDFRGLIATINNNSGDAKLDNSVLENAFQMGWPTLKTAVEQILRSHQQGAQKEKRPERDILEEVLELARQGATRGFPRAAGGSNPGHRARP